MYQLIKVKSIENKGIWFAIISGLLYASLGYFSVNLMRADFSSTNIIFWRFLSSVVFLVPIFIFFRPKDFGTWSKLLKVMLMGASFYCMPSILFLVASRYIGTGQAMVIFFTFPVFVLLLNRFLLQQPIKPHYIFASLLILIGLALLVDFDELAYDFMGVGLSLLSAFSYAIYIFWSKKESLPALSSTMMVSLGCAFSSGLLAFFDHTLIVPSNIEQWFNIIVLGIVCSAIPILLMLEALKYISSDKASLLSVLEPIFTVFYGVMLLDETLNAFKIWGIAFTLIGVMIALMRGYNNLFSLFSR